MIISWIYASKISDKINCIFDSYSSMGQHFPEENCFMFHISINNPLITDFCLWCEAKVKIHFILSEYSFDLAPYSKGTFFPYRIYIPPFVIIQMLYFVPINYSFCFLTNSTLS